MVEFDIQNKDGVFYLGHPPRMHYDAVVSEALQLFTDTTVLPKVDIKCLADWKKDISLLANELNSFSRKVLVNIDWPHLTSSQVLASEKYLLDETGPHVLLNIDIERYQGFSKKDIENHINSLKRPPFSVSPKLERDYDSEIKLADECSIKEIHFWTNYSRMYSEEELLEIYHTYTSQNFIVRFNIDTRCIKK